MQEEEIIEKILREQDLLCYYAVNNDDVIFDDYIKEEWINYRLACEFYFNDEKTLQGLSTENLLRLLASFRVEDQKQQETLIQIIMQRIEKEGFSYGEIEIEVDMKAFHSTNRIWTKLGNENTEKITNSVIHELKQLQGTEVEGIARSFKYVADGANFLKYYKQGVFSSEKIKLLEEMVSKDEGALNYVNFGIFQDDIFSLGEEFIKYLAKFPNCSNQFIILQKNNPKLFQLLASQIQGYDNFWDNLDEIEVMLKYCTKNCFDIQLDKIDEQARLDLLECAIKREESIRDGRIINVEYGENYAERLEQEYSKKYQVAYMIFNKRNVYFNKRFSMSERQAMQLLEEYGQDIDNIKGISDEDKAIFREIRDTLRIKDQKQLDELFAKCSTQYHARDVLQLKHRIEKALAKDYEQTTHYKESSEEQVEFNGQKIKLVRLTNDFEIFVHSTDSGFINERQINERTDFVELWKKGEDKSNHIISMSLITQDFMGCAPVNGNGVMYGFSSVKSENIRLMGATDINTYSRKFSYGSLTPRYMTSGNMPYSSRRVYSEFGIERENVTPDYVILFDDMSEQVKQNTYKAASQFGIPIMYLDKREIEQQQLSRLQEMRKKFEETHDVAILRKMLSTYETNVAGWLLNRSEEETDETFTKSVQNERFREDFQNMWCEIQETLNKYLNGLEKEQIQESEIEGLTSIMETVLHEKDLYRGTDATKPITKTNMSYDAKAVVQLINQTFERLGIEQYKVSIEELPTAEEYRITIKEVMKNALSGPNKVTSEDVQAADAVMQNMKKSRDTNQEEQRKLDLGRII